MGDASQIDFSQFKDIDLLIGGSPCQDLSIAKKDRQGLEGERSSLFWVYVDALKTIKPKYFLFENVVGMPEKDKQIISEALGTNPIEINSALVSAQNRRRLYWTNIGEKYYNLFGFPTCTIPLPKDKKILLQDILESGISYKDKSYCVVAGYYKASFPRDLRGNKQFVAEPAIFQLPRGFNNGGIKTDKAPTMTTGQWEYNNLLCEPVRIGTLEGLGSGQANRIYSVRGKSVCLNANGGGGGAKTGLYKIDLPDGEYIIRKLTPIECERLQTFPDDYTKGVSSTQRYKSLGNSWTVDVIAHIFSFIGKE